MSAINHFSLRDAWDITVIAMLLGVLVYFSYYVRDDHIPTSAWPQIKEVKIDGNLNAEDRQELKNIVRARITRGFFHVPMNELEQRLAGLPWVYRAKVRRVWPDTLTIKIYAEVPMARWGNSGLMNTDGELFFPSSIESYNSLPMLFGEQIRAKNLARVFEDSMQQLEPLGLQLQGLFEDQRQSKHLILSNGLILTVGDGGVEKKIARFITAYEQYLSSHLLAVKKVDLRYTNGLAVEWKNPQLENSLESGLSL